jgi:hypothetical protein
MDLAVWLAAAACFLPVTGAFLPAASSAQPHPNFSGAWLETSRSCQPANDRPLHPQRLVIDHKDTSFRILSKSSAGELSLSYDVGGKPLHYTGLDGDDFHSKAQWRGQTLVFDIREMEDKHLVRAQEAWDLTEQGTGLRRVKKEDGPQEHSTCTSLFKKDEEAPVKISLKKDRVSIDIDGHPFTNLYMGQEARKPFLYPLTTASGQAVTRGFPVEPLPGDPTDHPHQKGLWVGSENLSGMDLWENDPSYHRPRMGSIAFKDVLATESTGDSGSFTMLADWLSPEGDLLVTEKRKMTFYAKPSDCRIVDVDLNLRARREVTFEDHQDSVIGIRLGPAFAEKNGGRAISARGDEREAGVRGKQAEWVDWQTDLHGEKVGVTLMDHPSNYNAPTRWHIRAMGLLVANTFGRKTYDPEAPSAAKTLRPSEEIRLRYRLLIHPQGTDVSKLYQEFAAQ